MVGLSIWITRSRSPTSMPSSSTLVATITQSSAVGEGVLGLPSLLLAQRAVRDEGRDAQLPQLGAKFFRSGPAVHEDQPLLAAVQPGDDDGRVLQRADVVQLDLGLRRCRPPRAGTRRGPPAHEPASQSMSSSGFPTVADSPIRCSSRPASRVMRSRTDSRCQPRSSPAKAWISSTITARRLAEQAAGIDVRRDQHHLQRLGRREQAVGRIAEDVPPGRGLHVAVPERRPPAQAACSTAGGECRGC